MHSVRFDLPVVFTQHARARMAERDVNTELVVEIVDTGTLKDAGNAHYSMCKHLPGRTYNLLCVAAVIDNAVVVKTIMHHRELQP